MTSTEHNMRADMLAHMGSLQQAAYVRPIEYQEGRAHGLKAIEVKNGPLRFVSMADRALDVCQFEYRGENLTFLSKPGLNGRNQFDTNGLEAQRSIMGGLFFTCGFENICAPYVTPEGGKYPAGSFPMHGRIRTTPAEHVGSDAHWTAAGDYVLEVSGEMREAELFGENLVMRRKITSVYGQPSITVEDEVTNESFRDEPLMWMYHCNFGWPLLAEGAEVVIPSRKATPRDETTAADTAPKACTCTSSPPTRTAAASPPWSTASSDLESSSTSTPASSHTSWNGSRWVRATTWSASNPRTPASTAAAGTSSAATCTPSPRRPANVSP